MYRHKATARSDVPTGAKTSVSATGLTDRPEFLLPASRFYLYYVAYGLPANTVLLLSYSTYNPVKLIPNASAYLGILYRGADKSLARPGRK